MAASHLLLSTDLLLRTDGEIGVNGSGHKNITIDRILECAVALKWKNLTSFRQANLDTG